LPQAPRAPLPELAEFLAPLRVHFTPGPSAETLRQSLTGLLSEQPDKNCDTLAEVVPATTAQQFQHLLTDMVGEEQALNRQRLAQLPGLRSEGAGVLSLEETGVEKQGRQSVGGAHQYPGTAGKRTNGRITVHCQYAERTRAWPGATRLERPREGAEDPVRRPQAHGPAAGGFQPQAESARALRDEAAACGGEHAGVTGDADYGDNPPFLNGLAERGERHVGAARAAFGVTRGRGPMPCWRRSPSRAGNPSPGAKAPKGGRGPSVSPGAAGGWRGMAPAPAAGCSGTAPDGAHRGTGSIAGVLAPPTRRWPWWSSMRSAAPGWSNRMGRRNRSWAGIKSGGGAGTAFIGTRSR
jgi:SRSO17 transposase